MNILNKTLHVIILGSMFCCITRHAEGSGTACYGLSIPAPDRIKDDCQAFSWITNEDEPKWYESNCHLITNPGGSTCGASMYETGKKAANPPLSNLLAIKTIQLGTSQKSKPPKLCKCGEFYDIFTISVTGTGSGNDFRFWDTH